MTPLIQLTRSRVWTAPHHELVAARVQFDGAKHLLLRQFLDDDLLTAIQRRLAVAAFKTRIAHTVRPPAIDLKLDDPSLRGALDLLMSDAVLRAAVEEITGHRDLEAFAGAVYRIAPGQGHRDSWHDDIDGRRRVAITVNLSEESFEGGELQMRQTESERRLWQFANTGRGDALLFAIDPSLQHCIAAMTGSAPKTALAGWFVRRPRNSQRVKSKGPGNRQALSTYGFVKRGS
ncbi:MAG TPA: 2OG-Fe(II) oxygenase [Vicinamibacterales bacterium]|nr:2OG-Fe(II) oxygenase [Vicinamibacterales bacterium]